MLNAKIEQQVGMFMKVTIVKYSLEPALLVDRGYMIAVERISKFLKVQLANNGIKT